MTTAAQWLAGARPRTLPAAVAPVLLGTATAVDPSAGRALLALVVALALQVGVNYANDHSDGVRGTDADRVGPLRLVGSGTATAAAVKRAALLAFGAAAVAGLVLALLTTLWLVALGAVCIAAAWGYTGTVKPYGYRGLGEVSVFVFFGLVATCGTAFVQGQQVPLAAVVAGAGTGALACAILVANNLRDLPGDERVGKRTLAVLLGDRRTRPLYAGLVVLGVVVAPVALALVVESAVPLVALAVLAQAHPLVRDVVRGATGPALVPVLAGTGLVQLLSAVALTAALVGVRLAS